MQALPFWAWISVLIIGVALVSYLITRSLRFTTLLTTLSCLAIAATAGIHLWEGYLNHHIIARFDHTGTPTHLSRSGWWLLIDAWPLWVLPTGLTLAASLSALIWYWPTPQAQSPTAFTPSEPAPTISPTNEFILLQLDLEQLSQKLAIAGKKCKASHFLPADFVIFRIICQEKVSTGSIFWVLGL